jgi:lysine 2,3-aminomutase
MIDNTDIKKQLYPNPKYITHIDEIAQLSEEEKSDLKSVAEKFVFRTNEYYLSLIDWKDPDDPIRKVIIPDIEEVEEWGSLDASDEKSYSVVPGLEHKYDSVALLLVNDVCGGYCRFCFRKRLFMDENDEVRRDISEGLKYIRAHPEISEVLLTGGDPLVISTKNLENIIRQVAEVEHVSIIRIGTKIPAFNPYRIINDPSLLEMIKKYTAPEKKIYFMVHFNHPREITDVAIRGIHLLSGAGAVIANQTPLIKGINDCPDVLAELFRKLCAIGVPPYYVFQCRPTLGNKPFAVPIEKGYEIFEKALSHCSGLGKRARFVMSHKTGKIDIIGLTQDRIFFKYHRANRLIDSSRFMIYERNPEAYWLDDYTHCIEEYPLMFS